MGIWLSASLAAANLVLVSPLIATRMSGRNPHLTSPWSGRGIIVLAQDSNAPQDSGAQDDSAAHDYAIYCAKCHGDDGRGDGTYAPKLHTHPRDFANCAVMAPIPDATIIKTIEQGGAAAGLSNEMPGWQGALDDDEITALAKYIRGFCKQSK